jgi:hypothetical protein
MQKVGSPRLSWKMNSLVQPASFISPLLVHLQNIYSCLSKPACLNVRMSADFNELKDIFYEGGSQEFQEYTPANGLNLGDRRKILTVKKFCGHPVAVLTEE